MEESINIMKNTICRILNNENISIYLYGSIVRKDFKLGWSDIDLLCLAEKSITREQAEMLVHLRQELLIEYPGNKYFRLFEGVIMSLDAFIEKKSDNIVYWGTSGQRITDNYEFNSLTMIDFLKNGKLINGMEIRNLISYPSKKDMMKDIEKHYDIIRKYAQKVNGNIYSCGWILDIARCLYTLKTGDIIEKTNAGIWAVNEYKDLNSEIINKIIEIRMEPEKYKQKPEIQEWISELGPFIQNFADILEVQIKNEKERLKSWI